VFTAPAQTYEACEKLVDLHAWPAGKLDVSGWMMNFTDEEKPIAAHLLGVFMYFSESLVDALFRSAFYDLCNLTRSSWQQRHLENRRWNSLIDNAIVTMVEGEQPNVSDSGFYFARKARQVLGVPEDQLMNTEDALARAYQGHTGPIIFVDDFVGSGEQFAKTWNRSYTSGSFAALAAKRPSQLFAYCNAIMTETGAGQVRKIAPSIVLSTGNKFPPAYSLIAEDSLFWPPGLARSGIDFIQAASLRAGIPDNDGGEDDWRGFKKQGLALAFQHSTPDATLPLFYWERNWTPLVRRS
jgi:hypothetical protein